MQHLQQDGGRLLRAAAELGLDPKEGGRSEEEILSACEVIENAIAPALDKFANPKHWKEALTLDEGDAVLLSALQGPGLNEAAKSRATSTSSKRSATASESLSIVQKVLHELRGRGLDRPLDGSKSFSSWASASGSSEGGISVISGLRLKQQSKSAPQSDSSFLILESTPGAPGAGGTSTMSWIPFDSFHPGGRS